MKCNTLKSRFRLIDHSQLAGYKIFGLVCGESTRRARGCHYLPVREFQRLNQSIERRCLKSVSYIKKFFFGPLDHSFPRARKGHVHPNTLFPSPPLNCDDGVQCGINIKHRNTVKCMLYTIQAYTKGQNKTSIHTVPGKGHIYKHALSTDRKTCARARAHTHRFCVTADSDDRINVLVHWKKL